VRIARVQLAAPPDRVDELCGFYERTLALRVVERGEEGFAVACGDAVIAFEAGAGDPFHHFALLVPGDRFDAAFAWAQERVELLPGPDGSATFDFGTWPALAVYFLDPAGSIVELIAHPGVGEAGEKGPFDASELLGISEVGMVTADLADAVARSRAEAGIAQWDGSADAGIVFAGERAHTLIFSSPGRGWLPTGRPAEAHPVRAMVVDGDAEAYEVAAGDGGPAQVRRA
jgi:hypothetical protein